MGTVQHNLLLTAVLIHRSKNMAEESETKVVKRGRGRPPKAEGEKKAEKRAASANGGATNGAKKGRGRPKGSVKEKKATPKKAGGKGRGRPKKSSRIRGRGICRRGRKW